MAHDSRVLELQVRVRPNAPKTRITGLLEDGTLKMDVAAPPVKGKANRELVRFFRKHLGGEVEIVVGASQRLKRVRIRNPVVHDWKAILLEEPHG